MGKQLFYFKFLPPISVLVNTEIKKKIAPKEYFHSVKSRVMSQREAIRQSQKFYLFVKMADKPGAVPIHLN